ncbi:hypothetical protein [Lactococcus lactis]|uniref:hypothetical protein n=1 Tax=Lactococcus lactis TaxID=1358 RepID=UPI0028931FE0|nr:hypothetical protein [Lactococcus lactis]
MQGVQAERPEQGREVKNQNTHSMFLTFSFDLDFKIKKIKNRLALASPFINLSYIF